MASTNTTFTSFTITQAFLGAPLQFSPALGSKELEQLVDAYVIGTACKQDKLAQVTIDFYTNATVDLNTGALTKTYDVLSSPWMNLSFDHSPVSQSSGFSTFTQSPASALGDSGYASISTPPTRTGRVTKKTKKDTKKFAEIALPGFSIMTKDGIDVTNTAGRGTKTKEQREHAHLMRQLKACESCKRKKVKCDPSHRRSHTEMSRSSSATKTPSSQHNPSPASSGPSFSIPDMQNTTPPSFSPSNAIDDFVLFPEDNLSWPADMSFADLETQDLADFNFDLTDFTTPVSALEQPFDFSFIQQPTNSFLPNNQLFNTPLVSNGYELEQWAASPSSMGVSHTRPHPSGTATESGQLDTYVKSDWLQSSESQHSSSSSGLGQSSGSNSSGSSSSSSPMSSFVSDYIGLDIAVNANTDHDRVLSSGSRGFMSHAQNSLSASSDSSGSAFSSPNYSLLDSAVNANIASSGTSSSSSPMSLPDYSLLDIAINANAANTAHEGVISLSSGPRRTINNLQTPQSSGSSSPSSSSSSSSSSMSSPRSSLCSNSGSSSPSISGSGSMNSSSYGALAPGLNSNVSTEAVEISSGSLSTRIVRRDRSSAGPATDESIFRHKPQSGQQTAQANGGQAGDVGLIIDVDPSDPRFPAGRSPQSQFSNVSSSASFSGGLATMTTTTLRQSLSERNVAPVQAATCSNGVEKSVSMIISSILLSTIIPRLTLVMTLLPNLFQAAYSLIYSTLDASQVYHSTPNSSLPGKHFSTKKQSMNALQNYHSTFISSLHDKSLSTKKSLQVTNCRSTATPFRLITGLRLLSCSVI